MHRRPGHTYRIYDSKRVTVALDPEPSGHYNPEIHLYYRGKNGRSMTRIKVPHIRFATGYKWRRLGGLRLANFQTRLIYRSFT